MNTTLKAAITGLLLGAFTINSMAAVFTYDTGTTIKFAPDSTISGINVGSVADDPSAPINGDIWYKTGVGFRGRAEGATITFGEGGGSGTAAGLVYITNDAGSTTNYNPASDTDAARGTALLAAVAAATAGQTVKVGAGTFALSTNRLLIPDDVDLDLDPGTLITGTANLSTVGPMVRPGNRSTIRGGKIQGTAASGVSQAPFGISSFVSSPDPQTVDFVLDSVILEADSDAFYILSNEACTGTIRNCTLVSKYDIIYVSGYNGDPASHAVRIYNTKGVVVGPSTLASPLGRGTTIAYGATVDIHGGSLDISDGGTTLNAGAASYEAGTLNLYGVKITTSNGANPNYDLYTNGSGVIRVNGGAGSGTGGIFSTNSGANVTYTGNLSTGGNGTADNAKQAVYGTGGIFDATTEITVQNASTTAHAYLTDDGTIGFHAAGETNPRELTFPDDIAENEAKIIATREWIAAQGYGTGSVATDAIWDAAGDLVYGTGANTAARLAIGTTGQALLTSAGGLPEWTTIPLLGSANTFTAQNVFSLNPRVPTTDLGTNLASGTALTLGTNYYGTISSAKTLTFSGTPAEGLRTSIKLTVTNAPVLTIPSSKRGGESDSAITTVQLTNGIHTLAWEYRGGEYILFDTVGRLDNLAGTTAPTANEDIGDGYTLGSKWVDVTNDKTYECVDQTLTAAVWKQTGGTRTSAQLAADVSDETGSGSVVLATSPTLVTPAIGAATATTPSVGDSDTSVATTAFVQGERAIVTKNTAASYTVGTTDPREAYGGVIYVTGAATITAPAVASGMSFTVITIGAVAVSVDVNAADLTYLNGTALADGDKITNASLTGDMAVFTYYDATGWVAMTNSGWTDGN